MALTVQTPTAGELQIIGAVVAVGLDGVPISGASPTGDATAADVADGKTFSNAGGVGLTGTSLKNAVVPSNAPIWGSGDDPEQAYVDLIEMVTLLGVAVGVNGDLSNLGLTRYQPASSANYTFIQYIAGGSIANNALLTANIDFLLAQAAALAAAYPYDFSGPLMGVPTPVQARINGSATFQLASLPTNGDALTINGAVTAYLYGVVFDDTVDFSDHTFPEIIGIQDNPTLSDINTYLSTYNGLVAGAILVTDDAELPLTDYSTVPIADFIAGQPFIKNASTTTAVAAGATITNEEWVNRSGPQVLVDGAGDTVHNGVHTLHAWYNDRPWFVTTVGVSEVFWTGGQWQVYGAGGAVYVCTSDALTPYGLTFTSIDPLNDPAPTLTLVADSDLKESVIYV